MAIIARDRIQVNDSTQICIGSRRIQSTGQNSIHFHGTNLQFDLTDEYYLGLIHIE